jgi:hypothetical protein
MKFSLSCLLWFVFSADGNAIGADPTSASDPLNHALAETPLTVSISIVSTDLVLDGGSIGNKIRFSDGRLYELLDDFPLDIASTKVLYRDNHFSILVPDDWRNRETIEHGSAAERRLIELLEALIASTRDPHEKKNATSLVIFLKDRKRGFPSGSKWWDFTPWNSPAR